MNTKMVDAAFDRVNELDHYTTAQLRTGLHELMYFVDNPQVDALVGRLQDVVDPFNVDFTDLDLEDDLGDDLGESEDGSGGSVVAGLALDHD